MTVPECGTKGRVLQLPFLSSPYFKHKGRVIVNSTLEKAGVTQIKHIVNRKGDIDGDMVVGRLKEKNIKFRSDVVKNCLWKISMCVMKEWTNLLKLCKVSMQDDADKHFTCNRQTFHMQQRKPYTTHYYRPGLRHPHQRKHGQVSFPIKIALISGNILT